MPLCLLPAAPHFVDLTRTCIAWFSHLDHHIRRLKLPSRLWLSSRSSGTHSPCWTSVHPDPGSQQPWATLAGMFARVCPFRKATCARGPPGLTLLQRGPGPDPASEGDQACVVSGAWSHGECRSPGRQKVCPICFLPCFYCFLLK